MSFEKHNFAYPTCYKDKRMKTTCIKQGTWTSSYTNTVRNAKMKCRGVCGFSIVHVVVNLGTPCMKYNYIGGDTPEVDGLEFWQKVGSRWRVTKIENRNIMNKVNK